MPGIISASAAVKGGFFGQYDVTYTPIQNRGVIMNRVAYLLARKGVLALRHTVRTLNGAAAGAASTKTYSQIEANVEQGGKRTVETVNLINRVTTAADITEINDHLLALTSKTTFGASPVANKDGNPLGTR